MIDVESRPSGAVRSDGGSVLPDETNHNMKGDENEYHYHART